MNPEFWAEIIDKLQKVSGPEKLGFEPQDGVGVDNHGSMIWTCIRREEVMNRWARFALTEKPMFQFPTLCEVEIYAGADNSDRYTNLRLRSYGLSSRMVKEKIDDDFAPAFVEAMERAKAIQPEDLEQRYPNYRVLPHGLI